jgi:hypothetical protein
MSAGFIYFNEIILYAYSDSNYSRYIRYSNDGLNWLHKTCNYKIRCFVDGYDNFGIPILVAGGFDGLSYSYNGIDWVYLLSIDIRFNILTITYSNTRKEFIIYNMNKSGFSSTNNNFYRSKDGKTWSQISSPTDYTNMSSLIWLVVIQTESL